MPNSILPKKGKGRTWVRVASDWYLDPKYLACGPDKAAVAGVVLGAVAYSRDQLTDGFIQTAAAYIIGAGMDPTETLRLFAVAVSVGLVTETDGGWEVVGYSAWQETSEQVDANRKAGAERQQRWRDRQAGNTVTSPSETSRNAVTDTVTDGVTNTLLLSTEVEEEGEEENKDNNVGADATDDASKVTKDVEGQRPDVDRLVDGLRYYIKAKHGNEVKVTVAFRREMRLLVDRGPKDVTDWVADLDEIQSVIRFLPNSYRDSILSSDSFRRHYMALRTEMRSSKASKTVRSTGTTSVAVKADDMGILGGAA